MEKCRGPRHVAKQLLQIHNKIMRVASLLEQTAREKYF